MNISNSSLLHIEQVSKTFNNKTHAIGCIDFLIAKGEVVTLLGPSGCGKSTLLRIIAEIESPTSGKVQFSENIQKGFVFQAPHLMPWRNLVENVRLPLELQKAPYHTQMRVAKDALALVHLAGFETHYPHELSGGMQMRASLARALTTTPQLLLLDEPFSSLDENTRFSLAEVVRNLCLQKSITSILVTHSITEATFFSDRVLIFSQAPAKIVEELKINLPIKREDSLRTSQEFSRELEKVYTAYFRHHKKEHT